MKKKDLVVAQIITKLELGGAQKVCLSIADGLEAEGIPAYVISGPDGVLMPEAKRKNRLVILPSLLREISLRGIWGEIKNFFHLIKALRSLKRQHPHVVVHTHSTKAGLIGRWAALFAGIKNRVHTIHGYGFHNHQRLVPWLCIYALELVTSFITTHYVCVSSEDVKTGVKLFPRFAKKHSIIRAAVDWETFYIPAHATTMELPQASPFIFGTVACFKKQKNLIDLLQAFKYCFDKNNNVRLEIIGDGVLRPQLEYWIQENNMQSVVTLCGWQKNVVPFMAHWNAFVLSSLWEGLPCAIVEARLQKLPVISYNTGGIHDVIIDGKNGLLVAQKAWQELGKKMYKITADQKLYLSLKNYPDDLQDFKTSTMVQEHLDLYQNILS